MKKYLYTVLPVAVIFLVSLSYVKGATTNHIDDSKTVISHPGNQSNYLSATDSQGNTITVWYDTRVKRNGDIYAQKFDTNKKPLWADSGVLVCGAEHNQYPTGIISDENGGVIVVWQDQRMGAGNDDVYAQKINKDGSMAWQEGGIIVSEEKGQEKWPTIVSDMEGGAFVVWQDERNGIYSDDIYAQHISKDGRLTWKASKPIAASLGKQAYPMIISDNNGGAYLVWSDIKDGTLMNDTEGLIQHINAKGDLSWGETGVHISDTKGAQTEPVITRSEDGVVVAWREVSGEKTQVMAQKFSLEGEKLWNEVGVALAKSEKNQFFPRITSDETGETMFVWQETDLNLDSEDLKFRQKGTVLKAQRMDAKGNVLWGNGIDITDQESVQPFSAQLGERNEEYFLVWQDLRDTSTGNDIYSQKLDKNGTALWEKNGKLISHVNGEQGNPQVIKTNEGVSVIFSDINRNDTDIFVKDL